MTTMQISNRFDEPVTQEVLDQAIERGRKRGSAGIRATGVQYVPQLESLLFSFLDHSAPTLDGWGYCAFGRVTEGMDVVDKIAKVKTKSMGMHENVPVDMVLITNASRFE